MKYSPAALRLLGYNLRSHVWEDFVANTMQTWFKFSIDHVESNFAWYTLSLHKNALNLTHGGALMTYMDYCMAAHIWDLTGGKQAVTTQMSNKFIRPARIGRWLFGRVQLVEQNDTIILHGEIHANDPDGMLILASQGEFILPKSTERLDILI